MSKSKVLKANWRQGTRAAFDLVEVNGRVCVRKKYHQIVSSSAPGGRSASNKGMVVRLKRERVARRIFAKCPWISPLVTLEGAPHSLTIPFYEHRLGGVKWTEDGDFLPDASDATKRIMARQLVRAMFDIYAAGYAHCDIHPNNLYWEDGQIILTDFETMLTYPANRPRPPFPSSFDIAHERDASTMLGTKRNWRRRHTIGHGGHIFGAPTGELLAELEGDIETELEHASRYWHTALKPQGKHLARRHGQPTVYTSIDLPHTKVTGARNSSERLEAFHTTWARGGDLRGRSILDLGCNTGGMLFAVQKHKPGRCLGVEHGADKMRVARRIATYNALDNMKFMAGDLDALTARQIVGEKQFDIVFSFAVERHIKDRPRFYRLLGEVTKDILYFETNAISEPADVRRLLLEEGGFAFVDQLPAGPNSGKRALFLARK